MKKLSGLAVSTLLAITVFAPVGCFAEQQRSADCCGCMGDHGGYYCDNGECVDGSKTHTSHLPPTSTWPSAGSSSATSDAKPKVPREAGAPAEGDAGAAPRACLNSQQCELGQSCIDYECQ